MTLVSLGQQSTFVSHGAKSSSASHVGHFFFLHFFFFLALLPMLDVTIPAVATAAPPSAVRKALRREPPTICVNRSNVDPSKRASFSARRHPKVGCLAHPSRTARRRCGRRSGSCGNRLRMYAVRRDSSQARNDNFFATRCRVSGRALPWRLWRKSFGAPFEGSEPE
jgi:hypothetical protein